MTLWQHQSEVAPLQHCVTSEGLNHAPQVVERCGQVMCDALCSDIKDASVCVSVEECKECHEHKDNAAAAHHDTEALRERPVAEVAARLAQQDQQEQDVVTCRLDTQTC